MKAWIATTLTELEAAHTAAQTALDAADAAHTAAQTALDAAMEECNSLFNLLRDFRDFSRAQGEGGAP